MRSQRDGAGRVRSWENWLFLAEAPESGAVVPEGPEGVCAPGSPFSALPCEGLASSPKAWRPLLKPGVLSSHHCCCWVILETSPVSPFRNPAAQTF